jgi:hypothetical protein
MKAVVTSTRPLTSDWKTGYLPLAAMTPFAGYKKLRDQLVNPYSSGEMMRRPTRRKRSLLRRASLKVDGHTIFVKIVTKRASSTRGNSMTSGRFKGEAGETPECPA